MAWTYNPALATDADRVRLLLGDTNAADPLISDEEIAAMLTQEGGVTEAAARAAETLVIICGRKAQEVTDDIGQRVKYGDLAALYRTLATRLRAQLAGTTTVAASRSVNVTNQAVW